MSRKRSALARPSHICGPCATVLVKLPNCGELDVEFPTRKGRCELAAAIALMYSC
jgi:hypothetical protein